MIKEINVKRYPAFVGHEKVFYFEDKSVKLKGFIAWHNTKLGPATGGTRLYPYSSKEKAINDVLRLSESMTYKCVMAGVPFGGGKVVIMGDINLKNKKFLSAYANIIDSFKGRCTTGTDVGISDYDTNYMSKITPFILKGDGGKTTTSNMASYGVYIGIKTSINLLMPYKKNKNLHIAIKGVGKIGSELTRLLLKDGFKITVADNDKKKINQIKKLYPFVDIADFKNIHKIKTDVYSPCAMGGEFNNKTIKELNCFIIAGGANNQLVDDSIAQKIQNRGIWYIPDYIINAGGLIQIVDELDKSGYNRERVNKRITNIGKTISKIIKESKRTKNNPLYITKEMINKKLYGKKSK